ncbi:resuscitation-promoting factor [Nostocoides sp. F2B08]|uniref:resuscitation-promoting factor n=1 Tax=Nostocoides sp. F2B08 TaxID=2653936 RepID=UPI00272C9368|nr:resuscitation-promoting factor [Tetrasphaera sp. F2B08]
MHTSEYLLFLTKLLASRKLAAVAATLIFLTTAGAGIGYATLVKDVTLTVDGEVTDVRGMHATVADVLASEDIEIGEHDVVQPAPTTEVRDGQNVVVRYGRELKVNVDGEVTAYWTTATTLDAAIRDLGLRVEGAELSASRSQTLGREGLALRVIMPKDVTLTADGEKTEITSTERTVAAMLREAGVALGDDDIVTPELGTVITPGLAVTVKRVKIEEKTEAVAVPFTTVEEKSSDLYKGQTKTKTEGVKGSKDVTTEYTYTDGKVTKEKVLSEKVTKKPTSRVVLVGTKERPAAPAPSSSGSSSSSSSSSSSAGNTSGAGINLANAAMWDRIAQCESGGRWNINTGNGYYGGLQFNYNTWLSVGGDDFAPRADLASRAEQITVANRLYAQRGLQPWGCAHAA